MDLGNKMSVDMRIDELIEIMEKLIDCGPECLRCVHCDVAGSCHGGWLEIQRMGRCSYYKYPGSRELCTEESVE